MREDVGGALPVLQNHWLGVLTDVHDPPSEPKATCGDCVMCDARSGSRLRFSPAVKCCSYLPHLANFLVGRSLRGSGRASVLARMDRRTGVTPLGLGLGHTDVRRLVGSQHLFGRSAELRCPHYLPDSGGCAIWATRNAVCSTWFCQHERGAVSQRFWQAVRDLLMAAAERLAYRCLAELLPADQVSAVLEHRAAVRETIRRCDAGSARDEDPDDASPEWYARMWGDWIGREEEWFAGSADLVEAMDDDGLRSWMAGVQQLVEDVGARGAELSSAALPERLAFRPGAGSEARADVLRLVGYSPFDPLVLDQPALLGSLQRLDGRPTVDVLAEIEREHAVPLPRHLLTRLHDYGVAVPPA